MWYELFSLFRKFLLFAFNNTILCKKFQKIFIESMDCVTQSGVHPETVRRWRRGAIYGRFVQIVRIDRQPEHGLYNCRYFSVGCLWSGVFFNRQSRT